MIRSATMPFGGSILLAAMLVVGCSRRAAEPSSPVPAKTSDFPKVAVIDREQPQALTPKIWDEKPEIEPGEFPSFRFGPMSVVLGGPASHLVARSFIEHDLTNVDFGLEADLQKTLELGREKEFSVDSPVIDNEPIGRPTEPPGIGTLGGTGVLGGLKLQGEIGIGGIGGGSGLAMPGFAGRSGATKNKLIELGGGKRESERAVALGLAWLAKHQTAQGYWQFDGSHKNDRIAATGMCLLPFLAAGETHVEGKYKTLVANGLAYLRSQLKANGQFGSSGMYAQPIATMALCEAAGMTRDKALLNAAKAATEFIVKAQAANGSWGYTAGTEGDTSIVGWNIQALRSARLAGITVPGKTFSQAQAFLKTVANDGGASYGYRRPGSTHTLSAVGLLCQYYMGWGPNNPAMGRGVARLVDKFPPKKDDFNMYYYYYATQAVYFFGGKGWEVTWNPAMRDILLAMQITTTTPNSNPIDIGSWPRDNHFIGSECGNLGTTALAVLTLEVYYRHLPLYKRDTSGLLELER
jgi:hypothetical protein